jgi:hypothetical protein
LRDYIFIDQDIEQLRKDIYGNKKRFYRRLDDQCRLYYVKQLPKEHPSESTTYFGLAIANLSLAFLLTRQKHYYEEAMRWIRCVINYDHWGNAHLVDVDLSAAWILFGLSLSYDWLKDEWDEEERQRVEQKIILQARRMYQFKIETEGHGWSTNYWQNHNWINLTGLAAAGYSLSYLGEEPKTWTECAKDNFSTVFDLLADDGSDYEGVVYWRYGAMWLFVYAHLLKEREGIDFFKISSFLENTFYYRLYQAAPNLEEQINFGDCHDRRSGHSTAIYYKTAAEYNNGYAQYLGDMVVDKFLYREAMESQVKPGILPECFFELLFYHPKVKPEDFSNLPLIKYFDDLGLVIIRSSWEMDALHFSFKCGAPGGKKQWEKLWELKNTKNYDCFGLSHQHPDNNSFILHANGVFMAIDDGYNRTVKTSDHNMILVDGQGFEDENQNNVFKNYLPHMTGKIESFTESDDYVYIVGETAGTYKKELMMKHCKRHILYSNQGYIIVLDQLESESEHVYSWIMHADTHPEEVKEDYNNFSYKLEYRNGPGCMDVYQLPGKSASLNLSENVVRAVMTTQEPDKYRETVMKTINLSTTDKSKSAEFIHVLVPFPTDKKPIDKIYAIKEQGLIGIRIETEKKETLFITSNDKVVSYNNQIVNAQIAVLEYEQGEFKKVVKLRE